MNRRDRDRNEYGQDYNGYDGYDRDDAHYHSARNLTNEFEQDYQRHRGHRNDDRDRYRQDSSYHEGDMGGAYEQYRREDRGNRDQSDNQWVDRDRNRNYSGNFSRDRDRFNHYQDDFRGDQGINRRDREYDSDRNQEQRGNIRQGYGISDYDGTSDRFNTLNRDDNRRTWGEPEQNSGLGDGYKGSRYGGNSAYPGGQQDSSDRYRSSNNRSGNSGSGRDNNYRSDRDTDYTAPNTYRRFME